MSTQPNQIDQDQLIARLQAKDKEAFAYLYDHYSGALNGIISRIIDDDQISEEVLQDAFLRIWDKIDGYDPSKGRLFTWMANLSRNLAIDKIRSKEIKKAGKTDTIENFVSGIEVSHPSYQNINLIGLRETIRSIREEERFILEMVYFKGYTQSEITKEFDIPLGTVKTRLRMGLKSLRKVLPVE